MRCVAAYRRRVAQALLWAWAVAFVIGPAVHQAQHAAAAEPGPGLFTLGPDDVFAIEQAPAPAAADHHHGPDDPSHLDQALLAPLGFQTLDLVAGAVVGREGVGAARAHRPSWQSHLGARAPPA